MTQAEFIAAHKIGVADAMKMMRPELDVCSKREAEAIYGRRFLSEATSRGLVTSRRAGTAVNSKRQYSRAEIISAYEFLNTITL